MRLQNKTALITGASSGIGRATALHLAEAGCRVVITGRRPDRLDDVAKTIGADRCHAIPGDIADPAMPDKLIAEALDRFGTLDIVFNNAGTMHVGTIASADVEALCSMVRINVEAATRLAYAALRHFQKSGEGFLINTSSVLGTKVRPTTGAYAGTKHAIEALSEALRMEVAGTKIRVSVIEPGLVETELQDHFEQHPKDLLGLQQLLQPEDIARCVRFILEQPEHVRIPVMMVMPGEQAM